MRALPSLAASLLVAGMPAVAVADQRALAHTYEYATQPEGTTSLQLWFTHRRISGDAIDGYADQFEHRLEVEHGLTERWDLGFTTELAQTGRASLVLDRVTVASRYRFADRAEWPVDLAVALEASKLLDASIYPIELRVIAARDFDRLTLAANAIGSLRFGAEVADDVAVGFGWAAGATYLLHDKLRAGVETWGETGDNRLVGPRLEDEVRASIGPVVHLAPSSGFWVTVTAGFGLTDAADQVAVRAILGIEL